MEKERLFIDVSTHQAKTDSLNYLMFFLSPAAGEVVLQAENWTESSRILFKTFHTGRNNNFKSALKLTFVQPSQT